MFRLSQIRQNKLLKSGAKYSAASTFSSVVSMLVSFASMRWLGPEILGTWQSLTIVIAYLPFLQLGIQSGLNLELPIELGRGNKSQASALVATAKSFAYYLAALLLVIGVIVISYLVVRGVDHQIIWGSVAILIISITTCFRLHYVATYRSSKAFDKLSMIYCIDSLINLGFLFFIYRYQYYGLLVYYAGKEIIATFLMFVFAPYRGESAYFKKDIFLILLKRGLFMSLFNQIKGAIDSFPRVLLLSIGGVVQVGLFSPALAVGSVINMIPSQLAQFLVPQMGYKYGETGKAEDMWVYLKRISIYMPILVLPFSIIGWFVIPYVLKYFFPKYMESLWPIRIMLIGFIFSLKLAYNFLITIKAYREVFFLQAIDALCLLLIPYMCICLGHYSITINLSIGLSIGYFISYIVNYWVVKRTVFLPKYN